MNSIQNSPPMPKRGTASIRQYGKLLRVKHYMKNLLIFFPLVFSESFLNVPFLMKTVLGFLTFCLSASMIYIINDLRDIEKDRNHPTKCNRPLASGAISVRTAKRLVVLLGILVVGLNGFVSGKSIGAWIVLLAYILSNLAYSCFR